MEATITADSTPPPAIDSRIFAEIPDPRMARAAVERAAGRSWKQIAVSLDVDESTVRLWRERYPIDEAAKQIALEGVSAGALKLMSNFSAAVDVITSIMSDEDCKPSDRLNAASQIVRNVVRVAAAQSPTPRDASDPLDDVGDAELVEFVRAARARKLGPG